MEIYNRLSGKVIYKDDSSTMRECVINAIRAEISLSWANLSGADLSGANLSRANFSGANLSRANLSGADLSGANLSGANLSWANLSRANLSWANLSGADLSGANLSRANLSGADLSGANLSRANLSGADLSWANLSGADLSGANLSRANLSWANLSGANLRKTAYMACPTHGAFVGWKKCGKYIVKLQILEESRRSSATTARCRCDKALVLAIEEMDGAPADITVVASDYNNSFKYRVGKVVKVQDFDENRFIECAAGIHFYVDRRAAEEHN